MKRLLIAIAAAAMTMFASARVLTQEDFENSSWTGVTPTEYNDEVEDTAALQYPFTGENGKYGVLDDVATSPEAEGATCFDMYVQFKLMAEAPSFPTGAKIAVYADAKEKIHVLNGTDDYTTNGTVDTNEWSRLTIVAESNGYKVYVNGDSNDSSPTPIKSLVDGSYIDVFPADTDAKTVEFTGSGKLDNFVARTTNPFYDGNYVASVGDGNEKYATYSEALADVLASGATATITLSGETPRIVNGTPANPYEITNLADLKALQAAVADGKGADKCYVQMADIALTEAWPGIGIQNGKDIVSKAEFDNGAFTGTYDGDNHTISGFQMVGQDGNPANVGKESSKWEGLDYCGFFNSTYGATIKNLKIAYAGSLFATDTTASTKESGATFVGVAKNSTLQNLTSLKGTVSCSKGFGGIVGYTTSGTTVDSCTNNVNMTSLANNKCGGIAMITQNGSAVTIRNCQNNGTTAGKATEKGGIVGYVGVATTIDGCSDTAGSTPSILHNQGQTVTISGVITAPTNVVAYTTSNNNPIDGLDFATVDANGIATFVKAADLAAGNTYKVMGPNAAYAFTQAGTLALDQSLAAATVTADTSTLVLSDETVDTVTTYTAVAGVASVNNVAYATFDEAVEAIGETGDDFVTLLADATTDATAGTTLKVKTNSHNLVFADGLVVTGTVDGDITTYTTTEGMAKCGNTWYATFADAYAAALSGAGGANAQMVVKITSDFTPDISSTYNHFQSLTFTDVRNDKTDGLTINLQNAEGTAYMKSSRYFFPENATLNLASGIGSQNLWQDGLVSGGTFNIPDGVTVEMGSYRALNNVAGVTGAGRIVPTTDACAYLLTAPNDVLPTSLRSNGWAGTLEVSGFYTTNQDFSKFGNAGSTVAFNGYTNYLHNVASVSSVGTVEIVGDGLVVNGGYESRTYTIASTLVGDGPLYVDVLDTAAGQSAKVLRFAGDASGFSGSISFSEDANAYVAFGSDTTKAKCIIVSAGKTAGIGAGSTWTAPGGIVVKGTLVVDGSVAGTIYSNTGAGVVSSSNSALTMSSFSDAWNGTYIVNWSPSDAFNPNSYATSYSKVALAKDLDAGAYFGSGSKEAFTITRPVRLDADVTIKNGWGAASKNYTVTFTELTGSKNLTLNGGSDSSVIRWYAITTLDGFGGQINVPNYSSLEIGTVNVSTMPEDGDRVVPMTVAANGTVGGNLALSVGGTDTGKTLTYMVGEEGAGLYYVVPVSYVAEIVGGEQFETLAEAIAAATDGATVKLLADVAVTETQTISKSVTLDLNGKNVTATDCRAFHVTAGTVAFTGTGTISTVVTQGTKFASSSSVIRVGSNTAETNFTLGENVTVTSDYCYGITYFGTQAQTVAINGTVAVTGAQAAISGNGTSTMAAVTLTVGGTVSAAQDYAIYNPQTGTTAITGTVTGGIEVKAGTVTVAGTAKVTARNVTPSHSSNQNGTSTQGYAIASVGNSSYKQPAKVSVAAGATVTGSVIILKENKSETYGEITSAVNTLTIPEGYVWNGPADGVYTLAVYVAPAVIDPTAGSPIEAADEPAAQAAAQALNVGGMPEVAGLDQTTWNGYFTRYAEATDGGWVAKAALNPEAVFDATPTAEATDEQAILTAVLDSTAADATLQTAKPGLYYSLEGATSLGFASPVEGKRTLAKSSAVTVTKPEISGNAVFFRVKVSVTDKAE